MDDEDDLEEDIRCDNCGKWMDEDEHDGGATVVTARGQELSCCPECVDLLSEGVCRTCWLEGEELYDVSAGAAGDTQMCSYCLVNEPSQAEYVSSDPDGLRDGARYLYYRKKCAAPGLSEEDVALAMAVAGYREGG